jgi:hypothetical protein
MKNTEDAIAPFVAANGSALRCEAVTQTRFGHAVEQCRHRAQPKSRYCKKHTREVKATALLARIDSYLQMGGLFNPELMEHEKVRNLIMDCRAHIERTQNDQAHPTAAGGDGGAQKGL